ncbi:AAA family ATPase [Bifidobacterium amazonense]|uniref:AAA family ATPase n=1 Tax=Bifidobacterium amazonense TaxID=2809027 RepID=A0ABS9VZD9_9BIFI|nr:AAA family ATPase [Bifidobacterium amazonense]MCH9277221.1 AAA family ATPase [Bifidobacterium amazonense]
MSVYDREGSLRMDGATWKLNGLHLSNFRCFGDLAVDFDDRVTVLAGDNGSGKTTILEAAAIALGALLVKVDNPYARVHPVAFATSDMRLKPIRTGSMLSLEPQPVAVAAEGVAFGDPIQWSRAKTSVAGRTLSAGAAQAIGVSERIQEIVRRGDPSTLPLLAYYGAGRLWVHKKEKTNADRWFAKGFSRSSGYVDCLDAASNDKMMTSWFRQMASIELEDGRRPPELVAVVDAVSACFRDLTGDGNVTVRYSARDYGLVVDGLTENGVERGPLPFENLSDGYRGVLSLIADIAYRMAVLNPDADEILHSPGIVLIDEIDLHLHPKWQERVVHDLTGIFPNVQFIVSSHAPAVIASVLDNQIRRVRRRTEQEELELEEPTSEDDSNVLGAESSRPQTPAAKPVRTGPTPAGARVDSSRPRNRTGRCPRTSAS